ncbi:MAG: site-specific integrase [Muribaculaceae bacterium]|mgnify:CR=1 FL=1|nr:site-specific integrase [Muribaculaceae bacterium]
MTTINVKFRASSIDGQPGSIIYAITHRRVVRHVTSDYNIFSYEWDSAVCSINTTLQDNRTKFRLIIAQRIQGDLARFRKIADELQGERTNITADEVIESFNRQRQQSSFYKYMEGVICRLRQLNKRGTADNYQYTLQSFRAFNENVDLQFEDVTISLIEDYEAWLAAKGVRPNSSSFYIRNLRAVYNRAVEDNIIADTRPFRRAFTGVAKTAKRAISLKDIKKIKSLDLSHNKQLTFYRDIFLFQFYAMGISFIDVVFLEKSNLNRGIITYQRRKTHQEIIIPINELIKEIIDRYSNINSKYLFPIIDDKSIDFRTQYRLALRRMNDNLKRIATLAKLENNLTTYVSRHSWASAAKNKGIPIALISDALGHDSIQTTEVYLSSISTAELKKANQKILAGL